MSRKPKQKRSPPKKAVPVTWAQAFRDVVIVSMNRGQLPILSMVGIIFLLVWKMPDAEASRLVFDLYDKLRNGEMWAYILLGIVLVGWFTHARIMRREISKEYKRIGQEKSGLQSQAAGIEFKSSDKL